MRCCSIVPQTYHKGKAVPRSNQTFSTKTGNSVSRKTTGIASSPEKNSNRWPNLQLNKARQGDRLFE